MLEYLTSRKLPVTAEALFEASRALESQLAQSDKGISYEATTVVAFDERIQNPSYISTELRDSIRCKIARFSGQQYVQQRCLFRVPHQPVIER